MLHSPLEVGPPRAIVNCCDNLRFLSFTQEIRYIDQPGNSFGAYRRRNYSLCFSAEHLRRSNNVCSFSRYASEKLFRIEQRFRLGITWENDLYVAFGA